MRLFLGVLVSTNEYEHRPLSLRSISLCMYSSSSCLVQRSRPIYYAVVVIPLLDNPVVSKSCCFMYIEYDLLNGSGMQKSAVRYCSQ
jgi:hypothetical protein